MASKLKSVQIINNSVIKIYRNADREGRIINILNSYYTDIINTPRIIDIENGKITMEKLKACRIDWRKNKENDIINYIGNAAESLGRLHCINNNDLNESLPVETLNISEFIEKKYQELEKRKSIPDKELIKRFPDEIFVPIDVSQQSMNKTFNSILTKLSKKVKQKII